MTAKVLLLLALVAAAAADSSQEDSYGSYGSSSEEAKYEFNYKVKDDKGNDYGHEEKRDGDLTEGLYYNQLPDGRRETVNYHVNGDSGFVADVKYSGEAHYDSHSYESYESRSFESGSSESREYN